MLEKQASQTIADKNPQTLRREMQQSAGAGVADSNTPV